MPEWVKSPYLKQALRHQTRIDPDTIFGHIQPLKLEGMNSITCPLQNSINAMVDIFKGSSLKRFRVRGSSANWSQDRLTEREISVYQKKMGYFK